MRIFFSRYKIELFVFLIVFIIKGSFNFLFPGLTMTSGVDEFGTIAGAAFAAGYNWAGVVSLIPYYGFGYSFLMAPLFMLGLAPSAVHIGMLFYNTVCLAFCGVICYRILTKIFNFENIKLCVLLSVTTVFLAPNLLETNLVMNESMLFLLNWIVLYLLLVMHKRIEDGKKNTLLSLLLAFVLCYGFLVHTRVIYIWGAAAVFIVLHLLISKRLLVNLPVFLSSFAVFFLLFRLIVSKVQAALWSGSGAVIDNTVESLGVGLNQLLEVFSGRAVIIALKTLIGQLYSVFVFTGGFAFILFAALLAGIICLIVPKFRARVLSFVRGNKALVLAIAFTAVQMAAIIILLCLNSIEKTSLEFGYVNTKYFLYARYWAACAAPGTMLAIVLICKTRKEKLLTGLAGIFTAVFAAAFLFKIAPFIYGVDNSVSSIYYQYAGPALMQAGDEFTALSFLFITLIAGIATILILFSLIRKKYVIALVVMLCFSCYAYAYPTLTIYAENSQRMDDRFSEVVELFDNADIMPEKHPDIYFNTYDITSMSTMNVQFNLYRFNVIPFVDINDDIESKPIIVTSIRNSLGYGTHKIVLLNANEDSYSSVLINKNEQELLRSLENAGYALGDVEPD